MPIKRIKDESKLVAKWKLKAGKRHYFHVFLWPDQKSFDQNTMDNNSGESAGCVNFAPTVVEMTSGVIRKIVRPKLGEIHFIQGKWDMEIVAHELCHALIHRLRQIDPTAQDVVEQFEDSEEAICYEFGQWIDRIYRLLWKEGPNPKWKKRK